MSFFENIYKKFASYLNINVGSFSEISFTLIRHRELIFEMARRELTDRYAGQALGLLWAFLHPIFLMGLFVFIFTVVFRQRIGGTLDLPLDYTTYLLSGLVSWLSFQEGLIRASTSVTGNSALVKQVVFPLEILPVKSVLAALFPLLISLLVLIIYVLFTYKFVHWTYIFLPFLVIMQIVTMIGFAYILGPLGAYFRDTKDIIQIVAQMGAYLLPVFYLPQWVPSIFKPILYLNPFSYYIWCYQDVLYFGRFEHPLAWLVVVSFSLFVFVFGYRLFRKLRPTLGDLL